MRSDTDMSPVRGPRPKCIWLRATDMLAMGAGLDGRQVVTHAATPEVRCPVPPFVLHTLGGRSVTTDDLRDQMVILTFWATWCGPYRTELPLLSVHVTRHADEGLHILGFNLDEPAEPPVVREIAVRLGLPVGLFSSTYADSYGHIWRLPVNFTVDRKGLLTNNNWDSHKPAWTTERLERVITPLLH